MRTLRKVTMVHAISRFGCATPLGRLILSASVAAPLALTEEVHVSRFTKPMTAVINARHWDKPQQVWMTPREKEDPCFFDAAHRFLLVRFPGSAEAVAAALADGVEVSSATLVLRWRRQEWLRVSGYHHRGYRLKGKPVDQWHAEVWPLLRPWSSGESVSPTWNAYIHDTAYWDRGGARGTGTDRGIDKLG